MVSAKMRDSAGMIPDAEATPAGTAGQEASSRMRGAAASRAWRRVPGVGNGGEAGVGGEYKDLVAKRFT
jgi:hypothetical protein